MAGKVSQNYVLARRLKRLPTIIDKLERPTLDGHTSNAIQLTRMQDIGGCRVIFDTVDEVTACLERIKRSQSVHKIIDIEDRMFAPKPSGYRGVHVVFSCYDNDENSTSPWKKHKIEVQLRTRLQHAWATCVEMIDIFEKTQLKTRLDGDEQYREFFKLAAHLMAADEGADCYTPQMCDKFRNDMIELDRLLDIINKLEDYKIVTKAAGNDDTDNKNLDGQMLISLCEPGDVTGELIVSRKYFSKAKAREAVEEYHRLENDPGFTAVVLVLVKSVEDLKKAYPNYFVDTSKFVNFYLHQVRINNTQLRQQLNALSKSSVG
jgi:ppGpp synthetase/RelA/SpoT-type nucleotidyltranferase